MKYIVALGALLVAPLFGYSQNTTFTYQGRLNDSGTAATGIYDLRFAIYDAVTNGNLTSAFVTNTAVVVSNGLFTTQLDFGTNAFDGNARWIEIGVVTNGSSPFNVLTPRQPIGASPYAIVAQNVSGTISDAQLSTNVARLNATETFNATVSFGATNGAFTVASSNRVVNLNADLLDGLDSSAFAQLNSSPTFTGVIAATGIKIGASQTLSGLRASIAGGSINTNTALEAFIGGGSQNMIDGGSLQAAIGAGARNQIRASQTAVIGGGYQNLVTNSSYSSIHNGMYNVIQSGSTYSIIGGGVNNVVNTNGQYSMIGGGQANFIAGSSFGDVITGGNSNTNKAGYYATIGGGQINLIEGANESTIVGGRNNTIRDGASYSAIAGVYNTIDTNSYISSIAGGYGNAIGTNSPASFIGGGQYNVVSTNAQVGTIAGGVFNTITNQGGTIGGGQYNVVGGSLATVGGGNANIASGSMSVVAGGNNNIASGSASSVPGGDYNVAGGTGSFAAGHRAKANHNGAFVWADSQDADFASTGTDMFLIRAVNGVGIGTTAPEAGLHVLNSVAFNTTLIDGTQSAGTWLNLRNSTGRNWSLISSGTGNGEGAGNLLLRDTSVGAVRMILMTNGNVGIGTITPGFTLEVNGTAGKPGGGSWSTASDVRLKKNIQPLTGALEKLLQLRGVTFEYIDPKKIHELPGERMGVIAQEVEKVFPDWVETAADGYKRVTVRGLEALVVEALRQLKTQQEQKLAALEQKAKRIASLEKQIEELQRKDSERDARLSALEAALLNNAHAAVEPSPRGVQVANNH